MRSFINCTLRQENNSSRVQWEGQVACIGENRNIYTALMIKPEGKTPLSWLRRRWEDNIKIDLREQGWGGTD
jgi:hypothetical protein